MNILGVSAFYHDSAATLLRDGEIIAAAQEERFTRKKHDPGFPKQSIEYCLRQASLKLTDIDAVVFYEKPFLKFDRLLETYIHCVPTGASFFADSFASWIQKNFLARRELNRELKFIDGRFNRTKLFFSDHHLSHAASAFYPSPFEEAAVLTLDGVGEWATMSSGIGRGSNLNIESEVRFPHSLGFFHSMLTVFCGFKVNSGEYKLMGLAPYGDARFTDIILEKVISVTKDGAIALNLNYFDFLSGKTMHSHRADELFGVSARKPEGDMEAVYFDIAASAQKALEIVLLQIIQKRYEHSPVKNLCLAGGVALNCVANSKILKKGPFKNIWIQPAAGDAGGSLGAALAYNHIHMNKPRKVSQRDQMKGALLGPNYSSSEIESALSKAELEFESHSMKSICEIAAREMALGKSIGWFQGRMEFGPRALGSRSILADARNAEMQKRLNLQTKFRESFRPFAPVVLEEDAKEWFDFDRPSPYMLFVADVKNCVVPERDILNKKAPIDRLASIQSPIPAVTHIDGSARLQTVNHQDHAVLHSLLSEFKKQTGCPVLVNTSFNVRGEPIVNTPGDAIRCFLGTDLDILILENYIVFKNRNMDKKIQAEYHKEFTLD